VVVVGTVVGAMYVVVGVVAVVPPPVVVLVVVGTVEGTVVVGMTGIVVTAWEAAFAA